ncbi:MAG: hypothetical protein NUV51_11735 [Sulfuricaulis sp.]|nr:hypothetical protein [Sulfuricaulis sp.]
MNTAVQVVPSNLTLPAHLQSPDIIAQIAAANAAAAGGVRAGGFPTISIKANRFAIKDGDETMPLMSPPAAPGQPALPMGLLEVVVVDANPALSHTYYEGEWVEGENKEPDCRSANGVTPDADVATKQAAVCATCPKYAWGSAISKLSGKPIRACHDSKQLAVVPAGDLTYKMLGLQIKAGSLKNWGTYIQALSGRGYGVSTLVTNVTFDQTSNGVLQFTFNRFLTEAEFIKVNERAKGDDVRLIVSQSRSIAPAVAMLPPPASLPAIGFAPPPPVYVAPVAPSAPPVVPPFVPPTPPAPPPAPVGFNAGFGAVPAAPITPVAPVAPAPAAEPAKRSRRTRAEMDAAKAPAAGSVDLRHVPEAIAATIRQIGADSPAGQALLAMYPAPAQPAAPVLPASVPVADAAPAVPAAAAPIVGFGTGAVPVQAPTAQVVAAGASLADKLRAKLGLPPQ